MNQANDVLSQMVQEGAITADERSRIVVGVWPRRKSELLAPFGRNGHFRNLAVEHSETLLLADPWWGDYERDGDHEALATRQALFFRTIFVPTLASALTQVGADDDEAFQAFADRVEIGLRQRLGSHMILAKQLARLSYRGRALAWEHCQAALPGCGAFACVNHGPVQE